MGDYPKLWKCTYRAWWIIFFALQLFLIVLMIGSLGSPKWVYSENDLYGYNAYSDDIPDGSRFYNGNKFEGSLTECKEGCDGPFSELANDWCDYYDRSDTDYDQSICAQFALLAWGAGAFIICEIIALVSIVFWASAMGCYMCRINCMWLTYCCSACMWVSHYIGIFLWLAFTGANYGQNCSKTPSDGERPEICTSDGSNLALFILLIIPFIVIFFCIIACKIQRKAGGHGFMKKIEEVTNNVTVMAQYPGGVPYVNPVIIGPPPSQYYAQSGVPVPPYYPAGNYVGDPNAFQSNYPPNPKET